MTATLEAALRALRAEGATAPPKPYRNPRRDYDAEIEQRRAERDPAEAAAARYRAEMLLLDAEEDQ